jgi:hypothetical protein
VAAVTRYACDVKGCPGVMIRPHRLLIQSPGDGETTPPDEVRADLCPKHRQSFLSVVYMLLSDAGVLESAGEEAHRQMAREGGPAS